MTENEGVDRYAMLIKRMCHPAQPFYLTAEDTHHIQVERGSQVPVLPLAAASPAKIIDASGHARPVYRPLLIYSWLCRINPGDRNSIYPWIETLDDSIWSHLARFKAGQLFGEKGWTESSRQAFDLLIGNQQTSGAFLPEDRNANPETRWFEELTLLHAVASYSTLVDDPSAILAMNRAATFHLHETQPDHASAQPWGLLAFIRFAPPLADQVLHALAMQYPAGVNGVPLLLLTDVLYGLQLLTRKRNEPQSALDNQ